MSKEPLRYEEGRPIFEGQIEPAYTKFTWLHSLWEQEDDWVTSSVIAIAAVLCDHANASHCVAWPSLDRIAKCSHLSVRHVTRLLKTLEIEGWINFLRRGGGMRKQKSIHDQARGFSNIYQLIIPRKVDNDATKVDIINADVDTEGSNLDTQNTRGDIKDTKGDRGVQGTISEQERGNKERSHSKQEGSLNAFGFLIEDPYLNSTEEEKALGLRVMDLVGASTKIGIGNAMADAMVKLIGAELPHLVFVGDLEDKFSREIREDWQAPGYELFLARVFISIRTFYEGNSRAKKLKPAGIYNAFEHVRKNDAPPEAPVVFIKGLD